MKVNAQLFDKPSGNVRGVAHVTVTVKGKTITPAQATLFTDKPAEINLSIPKRASVTDARELARAISFFADEIDRL